MRLVVGLSDTLDKPDLGAGLEMRRAWAGRWLLGRPVSDKLGSGWVGWADRPGQQAGCWLGWA